MFKVQSFNYFRDAELERAAINLAKEGFLGNIFSDVSGKSAHVAPLYPALLSMIYYIFGDTVAGQVVKQLLAATVTVISIGFLPIIAQKARLSPLSGILAGFCMALLPLNLWLETTGGWEQPYTALCLLCLLWIFCTLQETRWHSQKMVIIAGIFLGLTALLSPSLIPTAALMFITELIAQKGRRKHIFLSGILIVFLSLIIITPWMLRNYYVLGGFIPIRSNFGLELAVGNNPKAMAKDFPSAGSIREILFSIHPYSNSEECRKLIQLGEKAYMQQKQQEALKWIKENPRSFIKLTLKRFWFFWFPSENMWISAGVFNNLKSLILCIISIGAFCGLYRLELIKHPNSRLFIAAVFGTSILYMITHISVRYRYPILGLSVILSVDFLIAVYYKIKQKSDRENISLSSYKDSEADSISGDNGGLTELS
jgi:hypothetical protein